MIGTRYKGLSNLWQGIYLILYGILVLRIQLRTGIYGPEFSSDLLIKTIY